MPTVTRDRGCLYYTPWIAITCVLLIGASIGIWAYYTNVCENHTLDALDYLQVSINDLGRVRPALIATCAVYGGMAVLIFFLSLWRSFVEAGHDATGLTTRSSSLLLVVNSLTSSVWFLLLIWTVFAILGDALWMGLVYVIRYAITESLQVLAALPVKPTWVPSSGALCPSACLDLSFFGFFQTSLQDACICSPSELTAARAEFDVAYRYLPAVQAGIWGLFVFGLLLLLNLAAQFSHTRREKDLITRLTHKQFTYV